MIEIDTTIEIGYTEQEFKDGLNKLREIKMCLYKLHDEVSDSIDLLNKTESEAIFNYLTLGDTLCRLKVSIPIHLINATGKVM